MALSHLQILIVEDHGFQRRLLKMHLENLGIKTIHEAEDGESALNLISSKGNAIDIIITDLDMPGMDGMQLLRHLGNGGSQLSVILISALATDVLASVDTMSKAYGIDLLGTLEKPLNAARLGQLLQLHKSVSRHDRSEQQKSSSFTRAEIAAGLALGQFEPFYQPKVTMDDGSIKGVEALARWRHPEKGIISPYAFIGLLEEGGSIDALTWAILERAARDCSQWRAEGRALTVSVNISIKSLGDVGLADRITELVTTCGLDPHNMILEITESATTRDIGHLLENLARLRMKGFGLSIDDYGTGYSSLQQLMRIPFTELKIDKSFVMGAARNGHAKVILESSLRMAKSLNLHSVAEGVETEEDWTLLQAMGCDQAQGYLIARPMNAESFDQWLTSWEARA